MGGQGSELMVALDDLRDLFHPLQFNDSTVGDQVGLGSKKSGLVGGKVTEDCSTDIKENSFFCHSSEYFP